MSWCAIWSIACALVGVSGWIAALSWRRHAQRYREAFDRAFAVARRAYSFSETEKQDFARIIGQRLEGDIGPRAKDTDVGSP